MARLDRECLSCGQSASCIDVVDCSNLRPFVAGEVIYDMGDPADGIWQVQSGLVALRSYTQAGDRIMVRLVQPRGVFGYRSVVARDTRSTSAQALCDAGLKHIPGALLERMIGREPRLGAALLRELAASLREAGERIVHLASLDARGKLLTFCADLARVQGTQPHADGFKLLLPISLQDLSELAGMRPETMSRTLRRLGEDGILARPDTATLDIRSGWVSYTGEM